MTPPARRKVLLVGWDAADWNVIHPLMDEGKLPTLARLVEQGVSAELATIQPTVAPMVWTSVATGTRPQKHSVHGFVEPTPDGESLQQVTHSSRTAPPLWHILSQAGLRSNVVGWQASHPAEPIHGCVVSNRFHDRVGHPNDPWPATPGAVYPPELAETLTAYRVNPAELSPQQILPFVPHAAEIDQQTDGRLGVCARILAQCSSTHAAATWLMEHQPWDFMAVYYEALDQFSHTFMPYHPPRQVHVSEADFHLYKHVVETAYRFHDMMLETLLNLAGPEMTVMVVSAHGFLSGHLRPKSVPVDVTGRSIEHGDYGIFVAQGPGIKRDELVHGLSVLDVAPTVLNLFGLPDDEEMDGAPALEAFDGEIHAAASSDIEIADAAPCPPAASEPLDSIERLADLGHVELLDNDRAATVKKARGELRYNLARAHMDAAEYVAAAEILAELYDQWPGEHRFGVQLAICFQSLDRVADMRAIVEDLSERRQADAAVAKQELQRFLDALPEEGQLAPPLSREQSKQLRRLRSRAHYNFNAIDYLWGCVYFAEGDYARAILHLRRSEEFGGRRPGLPIMVGDCYLQVRQTADACRCFKKAIEIDPRNAQGWLGLAKCALRNRKFSEAAGYALEAIALQYHNPRGHCLLGVAMTRMGRIDQAVQSLETAIRLHPNFAEAHRRLAKLYEVRRNDPAKAAQHRQLAEQMRDARRAARTSGADYKQRAWTPPASPLTPNTRNIWSAVENPQDKLGGRPIVVVSGLSHDGTTLVMRVLAAGGLALYYDGHDGKFEHSLAGRLPYDKSWLPEAVGRAVKITPQFLSHLPGRFQYRVLLVECDLDALAANSERLKLAYAEQIAGVRIWLAEQPNVLVMSVSLEQIVADPWAACADINELFGGNLATESMADAACKLSSEVPRQTLEMGPAG